MDPISIVGITIALVGASLNVSEGLVKFISHIKNTPNELLQASNDVTDFRLLLLNIEDLVRDEERLWRMVTSQSHPRLSLPDPSNNPAAAPEAQTLLRRAEARLNEMQEVVGRFTELQSATGFRTFALVRVLDRRKLKILRDDLNSLKVSIASHFSVKGSTCALRSGLLVARLSEQVSRGALDSEEQKRTLQNILHQVSLIAGEEPRTRTLTHWTQDPAAGFDVDTANPQIEPPSLLGDPVTASNDVASGTIDYSNFIFKLDVSRDISDSATEVMHVDHSVAASATGDTGDAHLLSSTDYSCDEPSTCFRPSAFSATFTYYFPAWFIIKQMFSLVLVTTPLGDPGGVLKIRRIQYSDFRIFRMASIGNWRGIKALLNRNIVHPSTTWWGGWSPLHYAISNGQTTVCKYLLSRNANPLLEDGDNQQSALEYVWMKILGKRFASPRLLEFQSIFSNRECLEELGFSPLHKIVLGLHGGSLLEQLTTFPENIDITDHEGRTALSWAAERGDLENLTLLLSRNADANTSNSARTTPLHFAVTAANPSCILPLLRAGADPNAADHRLHTPLHAACKAADDPRYIAPLLLSGAGPNAMTDYAYTPLIIAAESNHPLALHCLLDHNADVNLRGQLDKTPLAYTVEYNSHHAPEALLARGAAYNVRPSQESPTIAHFAAKFADIQTLEILGRNFQDGDFEMEDLEAEDGDGRICRIWLR